MGEDTDAAHKETWPSMDPRLDSAFFRNCLENAPDAIFVSDRSGRLLYRNPQFQCLLGGEISKASSTDTASKETEGLESELAAALAPAHWTEMSPGQSIDRHCHLPRSDGSLFGVRVRMTCFEDDGERRFLGVARPQLAGEAPSGKAQSNRLYEALSKVSQAIVWIPSRDELFDRICKVLVKAGGFSMAWFGWFDAESRKLVPLAACGDEYGYLRQIDVVVEHPALGKGPSGQAFESGVPQICNDLLSDPATRPWHRKMDRSGFRASASLPIRLMGTTCATLNVYADEVGYFGEREVALLAQAADDISFALDNFQREQYRKEAEDAARSERIFSDMMIDSLPGILYLYDETGRFMRWNRHFESVSGYSGDQIAGMHPLDFFAPVDHTILSDRIADVFETGEAAVEAGFLARDGSSTPFLFTGRRVEFEGKRCLVGVGIDISQRKQAEADLRDAERRFELVVENLNLGLVIADSDNDLLHWNPHSLKLLGFDDLAEGHRSQRDFARIFEISTLDGIILAREDWPLARARRGQSVENLELNVRRIGTSWSRIFSYRGGQVRYGNNKQLVFMTINDITARKQAQRALQESHQNLERKVTERTRDLKEALTQAESADRLKSAFLATMSHELRTPLNSIIGFTGIILQGLAGPLNAEQHKQLGMVRVSAHHLLELINDVLDISKIEAGQLDIHPKPFALQESLQRVVAMVRPLAETKGLDLNLELEDAPETLISDRRRVEQILLNLLHNAIKFTEHGQIRLRVEVQRGASLSAGVPVSDTLRMSVSDTGSGIRAEDLGKLFQPFRQVDSGLTRQHEGTGLGLAISYRLCRLLDGDITVESRWKSGSTFMVELPMSGKN
jgi:PAS domain S-box-containing protein